MPDAFSHLRGRKYIDLVTFRKSGVPVHTPVWFADENGKLYIFSRAHAGKMKRIRNNPRVEIAPSTIRGRALGPYVAATARVAADQNAARQAIRGKYWLARIPWLWSKDNVYVELSPA
ncbi:MAG: PPOX class F420-dependent oxidoreductase [Acidobacteriia bacterium]|nr:PPOX class F420-dependent oxidoreductase [Terriglobia bacterium]